MLYSSVIIYMMNLLMNGRIEIRLVKFQRCGPLVIGLWTRVMTAKLMAFIHIATY